MDSAMEKILAAVENMAQSVGTLEKRLDALDGRSSGEAGGGARSGDGADPVLEVLPGGGFSVGKITGRGRALWDEGSVSDGVEISSLTSRSSGVGAGGEVGDDVAVVGGEAGASAVDKSGSGGKTTMVSWNSPEAIVRSVPVASFRAWLEARLGMRFKTVSRDLALVTYVASTVPVCFDRGKERLRMLAFLGDKLLDTVVAERCAFDSETAEFCDGLRQTYLGDVQLAVAAQAGGLFEFVRCGNVNLAVSKTGGTAVEAVVGMIYCHLGLTGVRRFVDVFKIIGHNFKGNPGFRAKPKGI